jgi:hypothetical protein
VVDQGPLDRAARDPRLRRPPQVIDTNPCRLLERRERPHAGESRKRFLTDDEMKRLLAAASRAGGSSSRSACSPGCGSARRSRSPGGDIDFDAGVLRVRYQLGRDGKRVRIKTPSSRRDVILMDALATMLRARSSLPAHSRDRDFVFATATGTAVSARNATRAFEKAVERAKLEGVTNHTLRHTFASMLIAQGRDPVFVADQLGHKDPAITLRTYAHLFRAAKQARAARDQLDAEFGHLLLLQSAAKPGLCSSRIRAGSVPDPAGARVGTKHFSADGGGAAGVAASASKVAGNGRASFGLPVGGSAVARRHACARAFVRPRRRHEPRRRP